MSSLTTLPKKFSSGHQIRPRGAKPVNPIKALQDREWRRKQMAAAAQAAQARGTRAGSVFSDAGSPAPAPAATTVSSSRLQCPNKSCKNPNVVDGTCRTCGRVADDSNIVAEVTFGENSQGAAVVQGSFLSADQGGIRPMAGIGHRRVAGNGSAEARERTLREAKMLMTGYAHQLNIPEHTVTVGFQYYKLASSANFVQGRKIQNVVAVCLYAACRKSTHANPCKIMLIDLADLVKEEVFFLGRTFKKLLQTIEVAARDVQPIYVEDLIFRFASKLEFDTMTNKVAETAVRLVQRMDRDWMVMGRRPAGICGACLIMAARMYNFRRTVREVVYIAKVTMATLQMRLDEFKELPSAKMTVEEFLAQDFLSEEYDPPSIYKKTEEYQAKMLAKKRAGQKRKRTETAAENATEGAAAAATTTASASASPAPTSSQPTRVDADGFVVPPLPQNRQTTQGPQSDQQQQPRQQTPNGGQAIPTVETDADADEDLDALAQEFGDTTGGDDSPTEAPAAASVPSSYEGAPRKRRRGPPEGSSCRTLPAMASSDKDNEPDYVDDVWRADEENLEMEMMEAINSPGCLARAQDFANEQASSQQRQPSQQPRQPEEPGPAMRAASATPSVVSLSGGGLAVSENPEVDEDEFRDDPEVQFCLLSEEEAAAKEKIWMNENRAYLRMRQEKEFRAKMAAANGTKKQTRRRMKKPKIGEGQTSPASTPGEAAVEAMERRGFSKRINYDAMRRMLDRPSNGGRGGAGGGLGLGLGLGLGMGLGSSASVISGYTSSMAGSVLGDVEEEEEEEEVEEEETTSMHLGGNKGKGVAGREEEDETIYEEEEMDDDEINPFAEDEVVEEEEDEVEDEE